MAGTTKRRRGEAFDPGRHCGTCRGFTYVLAALGPDEIRVLPPLPPGGGQAGLMFVECGACGRTGLKKPG